VAVVVIYVLVVVLAVPYIGFLDAIPGISRALIEQTTVRLVADGLPYTPLLVAGGVPLKVYAALAYVFGTSLGAVLLWTVFARVVRIAPVFGLVALGRLLLHRSIDRHPAMWLLAHAAAWSAFYAFYFDRMARF
jgi:hypothetical protein